MNRKRFLMGFGAILALLSLAVFAACPAPEEEEDIVQIRITGIPASVGGAASYKIYVQLANSQSDSVKHAAEGAALLTGNPSEITLQLFQPYAGAPDIAKTYPYSGTPWTGKASFLSVVICPKATGSIFNGTNDDWKKAEYHSFIVGDGEKTKTFNWNNFAMDLKGNTSFNASAKKLFKNIIVPDPAVAP